MAIVGSTQTIDDAAMGGTEQPKTGVDLSVVFTPKVVMFQLSVLATIPILLGFFTLVLSVLECYLQCACNDRHKSYVLPKAPTCLPAGKTQWYSRTRRD